jgi:hypothetical protein
MNQDDKIIELEAKVAELTALVERLATGNPAVAAARPAAAQQIETTAHELPEHTRSSRRGMLKLAGAAAVGAAAAAATNALPAAAAVGDPVTVGQSVSTSGGAVTSLVGTMFVLADSSTAADLVTGYAGTLAGWDTSSSTSGIRAGVMGYSGPLFGGGNTAHGVFGVVRATAATGAGVYARSEATGVGVSPGLRARSNSGPALLLEPVAAGAPTTGTWARGAIQPDTAGNLWYCVTAGSPGTWRKLAGANTAGAFHALNPGRVYDSRLPAPAPGTLASGTNRTISVADRRDTGNGSVVEANFVPAGAIAVTANVTITETTGSGFLTVNPGGSTAPNASTINWFGSGQNLANGVTLTLSSATRELTVIAGGGGSTHFIVDISGYYL